MDTFTFDLFKTLLQNRSGLHFSAENRVDMEKGVNEAMQKAHFHDLNTYYHALESYATDDPLWKNLIAELTIGETYFFRDTAQLQALETEILPEIIRERREKRLRILRLWSAGCSSGEEPYSLAIMLRELLEDIETWHITIRATDINEQNLERARRGFYGSWSFRQAMPSHIKQKYFREHGNQMEIVPEIRSMVSFSYLNLVEDTYPSLITNTTNMDIILCRNVTIYFDKTTTQQIAKRFHASLIEGGWLVVGHSEPLASIYKGFQAHNFPAAICYRKPLRFNAALLSTDLSPMHIDPPPFAAAFAAAPPPKPAKRSTQEIAIDKLDQVYNLMKRGELKKARDILMELLEAMPQNIDGLFLLAKLSADEGSSGDVHEILDAIDNINPLVPQSHYLRALLHQESAAWDDAKASLRRALYADRNFALAHYYMGELLYTEGNIGQARKSWQNAANLLANSEPDSLVPHGDGTTVGTLLHAIEQRLKRLAGAEK